jgi:NO-binding membrane sensor protein with MHYT domain
VGVLEYSHDWRLVLASLAIALMAGFTGLSLTRGVSRLSVTQRKVAVSMAAVALGGGIWSMHFVAMLGLQLPIFYFYDALTTLVSALAAILMTGLALLILHFRPRTPRSVTLAGTIMGLGIAVMHYIGMSGMELCAPVYTPLDVGGALLAAVVLPVGAVRVAYSERGRRNILLGTVGFGFAVVMVHFIAMAGTGFLAEADSALVGPALGNGTLGIVVTLAAFLISAAFLLTGITFGPSPEEVGGATPAPERAAQPEAMAAASAVAISAVATEPVAVPRRSEALRVPHEKEGRTLFLDPMAISAVRAEGHYTLLLRGTERLFCPWSISEAEERLTAAGFIRVHRSYLVNPARVVKFERLKDGGQCSVEGAEDMPIPVSRARLAELREVMGL